MHPSELRRAPVPLLLNSFPQPPSFIPPSPATPNPPLSHPPNAPLPPVPPSQRPTSQASSAQTRSSIASSRSSTGPLLPRTPSVDDTTKLDARLHIRLPGDSYHSDDILADFPSKALSRTPEPDDSIARFDIPELPPEDDDDHDDDSGDIPTHAHALAVHRAVRARRSRSDSHKLKLRRHDLPPPLPTTPSPRSLSAAGLSSSSAFQQSQNHSSEKNRQGAVSPDIESIIDATPKPRRRSRPASDRSASRSRTRIRESDVVASAPSSRRTSAASGGLRSAPLPRRRASSPCKVSPVYSYDDSVDWDDLDREAEARLERALDGGGSDSDSSLDLHTPLPHLMVRHGLLSPNSKLLPGARPFTPSNVVEGRPGSIMSVASSVVTKSGVIKDERDTPGRRSRHRDGRLLRGGVGLTTGLGWSDSEDEDAPSLLTRRVSSLMLSRHASTVSLRPSASMHSLRHPAARGSTASISRSASSLSHYPMALAHSGSTRSIPTRHPLSRSYSSGSLLKQDASLLEEDDLLHGESEVEIEDTFAGFSRDRTASSSSTKSANARPHSKASSTLSSTAKSTITRLSSTSTSNLRSPPSTYGSLRMPKKRSTNARKVGSPVSLALSIPENTASARSRPGSGNSVSTPVTPGRTGRDVASDTLRTPSSASSGSILMPATPRDDELTPTPTKFSRSRERSPMPESWSKATAANAIAGPKSIRVSESWSRNLGVTAAQAVEDITRLLDDGYTKIADKDKDTSHAAYDSNKGLPPLPLKARRDVSPSSVRAALGHGLPSSKSRSPASADGSVSSAEAHSDDPLTDPATSSVASTSSTLNLDATTTAPRVNPGLSTQKRQLVPPRPLQLLRMASSTAPASPLSPLTPLSAQASASSLLPPSPLTPTSMLSGSPPRSASPLTPVSSRASGHLVPPSSLLTPRSVSPSSHHSNGSSYFSATGSPQTSPNASIVTLPKAGGAPAEAGHAVPGARLADRFAGQGLLKPKPRTGTGMTYRSNGVPSKVRAPGAPPSRMPTAKPVPF